MCFCAGLRHCSHGAQWEQWAWSGLRTGGFSWITFPISMANLKRINEPQLGHRFMWSIYRAHGNQGKHRVTKRGPALSYPMFTLVTGIVGRWRACSLKGSCPLRGQPLQNLNVCPSLKTNSDFYYGMGAETQQI
ncbi:unnamed protein product [Ranitomeya imitator]|uniref:Uncharacterized protein n=1 Tax=Ranitomeya imitator TaxID=111125 RepID=A0ABN9L4K1_9NEOB|nr:unnamed protein product [Ranitomeya imitator]